MPAAKPWELDRRHRHPDEARTKFERWIYAFGGPLAVAKAIDVHQVTVSTWLGRTAVPSLAIASRLIKLSKGTLSIDDILKATRA